MSQTVPLSAAADETQRSATLTPCSNASPAVADSLKDEESTLQELSFYDAEKEPGQVSDDIEGKGRQ